MSRKKENHKKKNHKEENYHRIRIGEKRSFPIMMKNGIKYISSICTEECNIEMGVSFEVRSNEFRRIFEDSPFMYQEIQVGDIIVEYDRFEKDRLYASIYKVCDICNNAAVATAVRGVIFYRDKDN